MNFRTKNEQLFASILATNPHAKHSARGWLISCPAHHDREPSLSIQISKETGKLVFKCHAGCDGVDVLRALQAAYGSLNACPVTVLERVTLAPKPERRLARNLPFIREHLYTDREGTPLYRKRKYQTKDGTAWVTHHFDRTDGRWYLGQGTAKATLYRLPDLLWAIETDFPLVVTEGEKDADSVNSRPELFLQATTPGGAGSWKDEFAEYFRGYKRRFVLVCGDNDEPGIQFAEIVSKSLERVGMRTAQFIPGRAENRRQGYDLADHLSDGGTL